MPLNSILKFFQPKDKIFFQLFETVGETVSLMGAKLKDVINEKDFEKRAILIKEIEDLEHVNDDYTHRIFTTWLPPLMISAITFMPLQKKSISIK